MRVERITSVIVHKSKFKGVYLLFKEDRCVYVGQTTVGLSRVCGPKKSNFDYDRFDIVHAPDDITKEELDKLETYYIFLYKPKFNKSIPFTKLYVKIDRKKVKCKHRLDILDDLQFEGQPFYLNYYSRESLTKNLFFSSKRTKYQPRYTINPLDYGK